jgi:enediyne biosynthesis protein E4
MVGLDGDGDVDFVLGNHGLNSRFRASVDKPVSMYVNDFDKNGTVEQIICTFYGDKSYPLVLRHDLTTQIPAIKKKYLKYDNFKDQTITDIFTPEELDKSVMLEAYELSSCLLINNGKEGFALKRLPVEAQFSVVYAISVEDFDHDGNIDIVLGGNLYSVKPEMGRYDAGYGTFLKGDGKGNFTSVVTNESGLFLDGEIRDMTTVEVAGKKYLLATRNNNSMLTFKVK